MTTTLTARCPEDILAAVPVVLGFHPAHSLVLLTFEARKPFHARVDLPPSPAQDDEVVGSLLEPSLLHAVGRVVLVAYTSDVALAGRIGRHAAAAFEAEGIGVLDLLRVDDDRWWRVSSRAGEPESLGRPVATGTHPFTAQAIFAGFVTHASREDLRASLDPIAEQIADTRTRQRALPPPGPDDVDRLTHDLSDLVARESGPSPEVAARVLRTVGRVPGRDAALATLTRDTAQDHLRFWTSLLRRAPDDQVPSAAMLVAFSAWLSGHGALAWCAVDRCREVDPDHRLAELLSSCLTHAVPPSLWEEVARTL
jgi:hypothetical protein